MSSKPICPCDVVVSKALGTGYCPQLAYPVAHSFCDTMTRLMPGEQSRALIRKIDELREGNKMTTDKTTTNTKAEPKVESTVDVQAIVQLAVKAALEAVKAAQPVASKATKGKVLKDAPAADLKTFKLVVDGVTFTCRYAGLTRGGKYAKYDAKLGQDGNTGYISGIGIPIK